jgi:GWxTD domain-containing protein
MVLKKLGLSSLVLIFAVTLQNATAKRSSAIASEYTKWLNEDVHWIISPTERKEFVSLSTDEQRMQFVIEFWERRNPNPGSKNNTFKQEHYRRLAYANTHFASTVPGWTTDRGHMFIVYGPPDSINEHFLNGTHQSEVIWTYRNIMSLRFVDRCRCGELVLVNNLPDGR